MASPLVSIIVPVYNAERYLREALESTLAQTYSATEIIAVDDGSTDSSADIIHAFNDRIHYIGQANAGQSAAINHGVKRSSGEYIKILDADDWLNSTHIESQLNAIAVQPANVAACRWGYFRENVRRPSVVSEYADRDYSEPVEWLLDSLEYDEGMMGGWKWLIPRSVWEKAGGYDERLSLNNDYHFSIRLLTAAKGIRFSGEAVYSYRKGQADALSAGRSRRAMESAFLTTQLGNDLLLKADSGSRVRRICANRWQMWLYEFYPEFADLAAEAEKQIQQLGGSDRPLEGGRLLRTLLPIVGWKGVRRLQTIVRQFGWSTLMRRKATKRLERFN